MNQLGRRTAHSPKRAATALCTMPMPGAPAVVTELLCSTTRRAPVSRARSRNGSMTACGSGSRTGGMRYMASAPASAPAWVPASYQSNRTPEVPGGPVPDRLAAVTAIPRAAGRAARRLPVVPVAPVTRTRPRCPPDPVLPDDISASRPGRGPEGGERVPVVAVPLDQAVADRQHDDVGHPVRLTGVLDRAGRGHFDDRDVGIDALVGLQVDLGERDARRYGRQVLAQRLLALDPGGAPGWGEGKLEHDVVRAQLQQSLHVARLDRGRGLLEDVNGRERSHLPAP